MPASYNSLQDEKQSQGKCYQRLSTTTPRCRWPGNHDDGMLAINTDGVCSRKACVLGESRARSAATASNNAPLTDCINLRANAVCWFRNLPLKNEHLLGALKMQDWKTANVTGLELDGLEMHGWKLTNRMRRFLKSFVVVQGDCRGV